MSTQRLYRARGFIIAFAHVTQSAVAHPPSSGFVSRTLFRLHIHRVFLSCFTSVCYSCYVHMCTYKKTESLSVMTGLFHLALLWSPPLDIFLQTSWLHATWLSETPLSLFCSLICWWMPGLAAWVSDCPQCNGKRSHAGMCGRLIFTRWLYAQKGTAGSHERQTLTSTEFIVAAPAHDPTSSLPAFACFSLRAEPRLSIFLTTATL